MDTFEKAIESLQHNEAPFWWLTSGSNKIGQNIKEDDLNKSVELLRTAVGFVGPGSYKLEYSTKVTDRSGSFKFPFTKGSSASSTPTTMNAICTNPYGIPDAVLKQVQDETRFKLIVEGMAEKFNKFMDEWPEYKKKIDTLWDEDSDGNGIADVMEGAKKIADVAQTAKQMKSIFS